MNVTTWQRIQQVFEAVVELPPGERERALEAECGADASLRRMVESLILCEQGGQLQNIVQSAAASIVKTAEPDQIGNYRIVRRLGEGGMGVVYEAEQANPRRRVALKLMRAGNLASERERRLFEREADALGRLLHPGIATIFESGMTANGQPFLVMEYIAGQTLAEYTNSLAPLNGYRPADLADRIAVFLSICDAITYAHQQGVIHRDLKPGNIMLTESSEVKVLDFGLARLTDDSGATRTETGVVQGSLRYMSPEQARGETGRVDTRSDIYSLGIILYELISGKHPYLDKTELLAAIQQICETPMKPLRAAGLNVPVDLDTILSKSLAKDPAQRYDSVAAFAADLRRFLKREPILARPATIRYQLRMLVGRNRLAAAAFAALAILVIAFGVVSFTQALRIRAERDRANQQAAMANEVSDFLVNLYRETNPVETNGVLTAKDLLLSGRKRLDKELRDKPEIRARLLNNIGSALSVVGPMEEAISAYQESIQILGPDSEKSADAWSGLAVAYYNLGRYAEAVDASRHVIQLLQRAGRSSSMMASQLHDLGLSLAALGKHEEALRYVEEAGQLDREFGRSSELPAVVRMAGHGSLLRRMGRYEEAIEKLSAAAKQLEKQERRTELLRTWNDLGTTLNSAGRHAEGEKYLRLALGEAAKLFGETHPNLGVLRLNLGFSLTGQKRWPEAQRMLQEARQLLDDELPRLHPTQRDLLRLESEVAEGREDYPGAAKALTKAYQLALEAGQKEHPQTRRLEILHLRVLTKMGQGSKSLPRLEEILTKLPAESDEYRLTRDVIAAARKQSF